MGKQGTKRLRTVFAEAMSRGASRQSRVSQAKGDDTKADGAAWLHKGGVCFMDFYGLKKVDNLPVV